jgi:hypothetical protein
MHSSSSRIMTSESRNSRRSYGGSHRRSSIGGGEATTLQALAALKKTLQMECIRLFLNPGFAMYSFINRFDHTLRKHDFTDKFFQYLESHYDVDEVVDYKELYNVSLQNLLTACRDQNNNNKTAAISQFTFCIKSALYLRLCGDVNCTP